MSGQEEPSEVPGRDKQVGEALRLELGAETRVWTERMLAALKSGVKGGKWFSLHDKTSSLRTLRAAWERVRDRDGSGGIDGVNVRHFERHLDGELDKLAQQLSTGDYRAQPVRRTWIEKPGSREKRPLGIPTIRDRVVQTALLMTIGPIFEIDFAEHSYGFRPKRSCKDALGQVDKLLESGHEWVVDVDLKSYFDTIDHDLLLKEVETKVADGDTLKLIKGFLKQGVMETMEGWKPTKSGTPQGAVISPLLSNLFLDPLDKRMSENGHEMIRYADDFVILCRSREEAEEALRQVRQWAQERKLTVHPEKTRIVHSKEKGGFEFLGYRFESGKRFPRKKSLVKLRETIRRKTRRSNGKSMEAIIASINPVLRGWFGYFKDSYKTTFPGMDGWVRMRLRSIYRKRNKRKGRGRGKDNSRYPNAHFAALGLYSLKEAHGRACQSR